MRQHQTMLTAGAIVTIMLATAPAGAAEAAPAEPDGRILYVQVTQSLGSEAGELRSVRPDGSGDSGYGRQFPWLAGLPDYSPDGRQIAYVQEYSVRLMSAADLSDDRALAGAPCGPASPRWSPDGLWIAFEACGDIYKVSTRRPADGIVNVTGANLNNLQPSWSPKGNRITTATMPGVQIYRAGGSVARTLSDLPGAWHLDWHPTGGTIAVEADGDLWLVNAFTGQRQRLTDTPGIVESHPLWSPDGRWLAYARGPADPESPDVASLDPQIWLMTAIGTHRHSIGAAGVPSSWRR